MKAVYLIPALPFTAAAVGLVFLAAMRFRRLRWVALVLYSISIPTLACLLYYFWDHYVGPDAFSIWQFAISPASISFFMPLCVASPLLLWAVQRKASAGRLGGAASALACFGFAAVLAAVLADHFFLLAGMFTLASWCMAGAAVLQGRKAGRLLPCLFPIVLADLSLASGILFLYIADPSRGLFYPAVPLRPSGMLAVSCSLMLASALLRLGCFPLHRWMAGMAGGSKDIRLIHLLALDLTLGTFLLFAVVRIFFVWDGPWIWICLGVGAATLLEAARELLYAADREEIWGLLCAAMGAGIALVAAPGGQAAAAAARLGLWAGVPALSLVEVGSDGAPGTHWARVVGGASLLGLPPLAGFAWLLSGFAVLAGEFAGGTTVIFLAAMLPLFAGALIMGTTSLLMPASRGAEVSGRTTTTVGLLLAVCCALVGLYPGAITDLFMREYGLPLDVPFASWTTLGWAALICTVLTVIIASAWAQRHGESGRLEAGRGRALPLLMRRKPPRLQLLERRRPGAALIIGEISLYLAWIACMVYLGLK